MRMRMGWGGVGIIPNMSLCTLHDLHLMMLRHMIFTWTWLRYMIFTCTLMLRFTIFTCTLADEDGDGVGRGGDNTQHVSLYSTWSSLDDATLHDLHLNLMLRYMIFTCTLTDEDGDGVGRGGDNTQHVSLYATWSSLDDATLHDLHLNLMLRYMIFTCTLMLRFMIFICTLTDEDGDGVGRGGGNTQHVSLYATWSSLDDATLHDLHLNLMLRYMIFTCTWCYASRSSLALWQMRMRMGWGGVGIIPNMSLCTLHDLHLMMLRYMIFTWTWLRYMIFTCTLMLRFTIFTCTLADEDVDGVGWGGDNTKHVSLYATWSSLDDATLHDLHLNLMLRYMIFTCTWCYASWSSLAFWQMRMGMGWGGVGIIPNMSLCTLHDLHLMMLRYMIFTWTWLRYMIFTCTLMLRFTIFTCTLADEDGDGVGWGGDNTKHVSLYATWSSLDDATLHDLHLNLMLRYMTFTWTWCWNRWQC